MKKFKCKYCNNIKETSLKERILHPHLFGIYLYMKCDRCSQRDWHKRVKED